MPDNPRFMATAIDIVLRAGDIQIAGFRRPLDVRKKSAIDLVTEVDVAVERMCRDVLAERFPSHAIEAEEFGRTSHRAGAGTAADAPQYCWIFDPLDGTTNYAHGLPVFCAALALEIDGRVDVAAIYDPTRHELFTAERGRGAFLNGVRLSVSPARTLLDSLLVTGFPYDIHTNPGEILALFGAFIGQAQAVRRLGSAALDLCYVAAGRFEGFWEQRLHVWDIAGASLLVEEAGGRVSGMDGTPFEPRAGHILATNGLVHDDMLALIQTVRGQQVPH
ncbi:MAG: inositol monophosphatase family protein [Vicinamibacterales bacterium]|nr:inositol monophosphatase family protein [Vicinamibacterales bacterium]